MCKRKKGIRAMELYLGLYQEIGTSGKCYRKTATIKANECKEKKHNKKLRKKRKEKHNNECGIRRNIACVIHFSLAKHTILVYIVRELDIDRFDIVYDV